ncbi:hypothetical protein M885DRAFT_627309 [Pelagophyceae sp. CCMP2097]|nr:hypothetical protein M885DRAFT_627309 [Pelagophyceae sp. CCMP2097]
MRVVDFLEAGKTRNEWITELVAWVERLDFTVDFTNDPNVRQAATTRDVRIAGYRAALVTVEAARRLRVLQLAQTQDGGVPGTATPFVGETEVAMAFVGLSGEKAPEETPFAVLISSTSEEDDSGYHYFTVAFRIVSSRSGGGGDATAASPAAREAALSEKAVVSAAKKCLETDEPLHEELSNGQDEV